MNLGLTGVAQINSAGIIGISGKPLRVFDVMKDTPLNTSTVSLYDGTSNAGSPYISLSSANQDLHSNVGIRFPDGCFVLATTCTASINYITEF